MTKAFSQNRIAKIGVAITVLAALLLAPLASAAVGTEMTPPQSKVVSQPVAWLLSLLKALSGSEPEEGAPVATDTTEDQSEEPAASEPGDDPEIGPNIDPWG